jgi:hypothetical protein
MAERIDDQVLKRLKDEFGIEIKSGELSRCDALKIADGLMEKRLVLELEKCDYIMRSRCNISYL